MLVVLQNGSFLRNYFTSYSDKCSHPYCFYQCFNRLFFNFKSASIKSIQSLISPSQQTYFFYILAQLQCSSNSLKKVTAPNTIYINFYANIYSIEEISHSCFCITEYRYLNRIEFYIEFADELLSGSYLNLRLFCLSLQKDNIFRVSKHKKL